MSDKTKSPAEGQDAGKGVDQTGAQSGTAQNKVSRRGVATARGPQRLKFSHELAKPNGLFIAHLASVEVSNILIGESTTGMPSFNGLEIPKIAFTFASNEEDVNKRHYQTLQFTAVESNVNTIPGGKEEWKVNTVFDWFKHILDVFVFKGRELTDAEADALGLSFTDFDEQGEYSAVDSEAVIAGWKTLFENVENLLNRSNDDKPAYKTKEGKIIALWVKLIRSVKHRTKGWVHVNNGDLTFPTFVGEGCIEIFKQNTNPSIRIDSVKETILPMNLEKAKAPNMGGGVPNMVDMPGNTMGNFGGGVGFGNNIASAAGEDDIPF